jgi:hypothetical protein
MSEEKWIELGKKRIINILNSYNACTRTQLEMKISEAGPINQRVEPIILRDSINLLLDNGTLSIEKHENEYIFFSNIDKRKIRQRISLLDSIYKKYNSFCFNRSYCGYMLEYLVQKALDKSKYISDYNYTAVKYKTSNKGIIIDKNSQTNNINGKYLSSNQSLDIILVFNNIPVGIEIKNKRRWKYKDDIEIWQLIKKCCELEIVPVFFARKIPFLTKCLFSNIGVLGLDTHFQFMHPCIKKELSEIRDKKLLGFFDIKCDIEPRDFLVGYFDTIIPENISNYKNKFISCKDLLMEYCNKGLADSSFRGFHRNKLLKELEHKLYAEGKSNLIEEEDFIIDVDF